MKCGLAYERWLCHAKEHFIYQTPGRKAIYQNRYYPVLNSIVRAISAAWVRQPGNEYSIEIRQLIWFDCFVIGQHGIVGYYEFHLVCLVRYRSSNGRQSDDFKLSLILIKQKKPKQKQNSIKLKIPNDSESSCQNNFIFQWIYIVRLNAILHNYRVHFEPRRKWMELAEQNDTIFCKWKKSFLKYKHQIKKKHKWMKNACWFLCLLAHLFCSH